MMVVLVMLVTLAGWRLVDVQIVVRPEQPLVRPPEHAFPVVADVSDPAFIKFLASAAEFPVAQREVLSLRGEEAMGREDPESA